MTETVRLIIELPCGCQRELFKGEALSIPFRRLPERVASVFDRCRSCRAAG